jgi:hypothetical protein
MSPTLHGRLTGHPGRISGLVKFLDHITAPRPHLDLHWLSDRRALTAGAIRDESAGLPAHNPLPHFLHGTVLAGLRAGLFDRLRLDRASVVYAILKNRALSTVV